MYSIAELDMLSAIHTKLSLMQSSGELERQKKEFIANSIAHILRPIPVVGVSDLNKSQAKSWFFNPSIVLDHTITSSTGQVIVTAGTKINPLRFKQFNEALIFINGDNQNQLDWIVREIQKDEKKYGKIKIILVNGDINQTAKSLKARVYFDQHGVLCKRFGIKHTPTMVYQAVVNGVKIPRLTIKEFSDAS
ncbi:MAG: hypothetical protein A3C44_04535 [Gammaproteobacteria bacterium RIFCSPHIGHO2_02_FULL_39_13]|nr:MAG: hypothetical protein A3C44_04535 [Gammaproteobacteria bacterium RIFCSPHIGHO2_02_FULL_39_13]